MERPVLPARNPVRQAAARSSIAIALAAWAAGHGTAWGVLLPAASAGRSGALEQLRHPPHYVRLVGIQIMALGEIVPEVVELPVRLSLIHI